MGYMGPGVPIMMSPSIGGSPLMMMPAGMGPQHGHFDLGGGDQEFPYLKERGSMLDLLSGE